MRQQDTDSKGKASRSAMFAAKPLSRQETASLTAAAGRHLHVLRVARDGENIVVATPEVLGIWAGEQWRFRRWETILFGGWRNGPDQLYWTLLDGTEEHIALSQPADLPFVFADRVRASIVTTRSVDLGEELGVVTLAGRRPPTEIDQPIVWTVQATAQTDLNDPEVQRRVLAEMTQLRLEFE